MDDYQKMSVDRMERNLRIGTVIGAVVLVGVDLGVPVRFNFAISYILLVLVSLGSTHESFTYVVSFSATCLTLVGLFLSVGLRSIPFEEAAMGRMVAIAIIWITAFLCIRRQRQAAVECQIAFDRDTEKRENEDLRRAKETLSEKIEELAAANDAVVYAVAKVAESRDLEAGQHLERIRAYVQILAEELRGEPAFGQVIDDGFLADLYRASPLHDIGKVCIRDSVLLTRERLVPEEYELMKRHTTLGAQILEQTMAHLKDAQFLEVAALIARCHHERVDGSGYPDGLSGAAIPLAARIVAVADVYDALVSERPYRESHTPEQARELIEAESGRQFDSRVVGAFLRRFDDFVAVQTRYPSRYVQVFNPAPVCGSERESLTYGPARGLGV